MKRVEKKYAVRNFYRELARLALKQEDAIVIPLSKWNRQMKVFVNKLELKEYKITDNVFVVVQDGSVEKFLSNQSSEICIHCDDLSMFKQIVNGLEIAVDNSLLEYRMRADNYILRRI